MPERRYSEEEVQRILTDAVEVDSSRVARAERGLTLTQIQRVAAETGISPESVAAAVATLHHESLVPAAPRMLGLPVGVATTVVLPGKIEDAAWRRLVTFAQDTFEAKGREEQASGRRQWSNGNLRMAVDEVDGTTLLHLRTRKDSARGYLRGGLSMVGLSLLVGAVITVAQVGTNALAGALIMNVGGLAMAATGLLQLPAWSSARRKQFQAVAEYARSLSTPGVE